MCDLQKMPKRSIARVPYERLAAAAGVSWLVGWFALGVGGCASRPQYPVYAVAVESAIALASSEEFARALEWRWNIDRISLFCRQNPPESIVGRQGAKLGEGDWTGQLHEGQKVFSSIAFFVRVKDRKPVSFQIAARKGRKAWVLESGPPDILRENRLIGHSQ